MDLVVGGVGLILATPLMTVIALVMIRIKKSDMEGIDPMAAV